MTTSLENLARVRWHLDARRELLPCGCLYVFPYGNPADSYSAYRCPRHRPAVTEASPVTDPS